MTVYNKLVRDKIPDIIKDTGKSFKTTVLNNEEYIKELKKKLQEEVNEYLSSTSNDDSLEELADILELIHALSITHRGSIEIVEKIRIEKAKKRGGFEEKIFLIEVED